MLYDWGAKEILISHNSEMLVYNGSDYYTCPVKARNLSGRTAAAIPRSAPISPSA